MQAVLWFEEQKNYLPSISTKTPKALLPMLSKTILAYNLEALYAQGIFNVTCLLQAPCLPVEAFLQTYQNHEMHLQSKILPKTKPFFAYLVDLFPNQTVLLMEGNALYDFEWKKAMRFHTEKKSLLTVFLKQNSLSKEAYLATQSVDKQLLSLEEQSAWAQNLPHTVFVDAAFLGTEALKLLAKEKISNVQDAVRSFLQKKIPIDTYLETGYWNAIETPYRYRICHRDFLQLKTHFYLPKLAEGIFTDGELPKGEYTLLPPIYIGKHVQIGSDVRIGPNTALYEDVMLFKGNQIKNSVILPRVQIGERVFIEKSVLGTASKIDDASKIFSHCVVGEEAVLCASSVLKSGTKIWPRREIGGTHSQNRKSEIEILGKETCAFSKELF